MSETQKRPLGLTIIAIFTLIGGIFSLLGGFVSFGVSTLSPELEGLAFLGIIATIIGIITLPAGYGLLKGKKWGWNLAIVANIISVPLNLAGVAGGTSDAGSAILGIAFSIVIILYLMKPSTKAFCSK
jgi:uncharacterized membrane protein (DUF2068 family)